MSVHAVLFYGVPGAGKGTQADLLARKMRWIHFDTGVYLKDILYSKDMQHDPVLQRERERWDAGELNDPEWVLQLTSEFARDMGARSQGIIFSGSPRTDHEAFGTDQVPGLISVLQRSFGEDNVHCFFLKTKEHEGHARNTKRKQCSVCRLLILNTKETETLSICVTCGAPLETRTVLDAPEKYTTRLNEFMTRTYPMIEHIKERGVQVHTLDASRLPFEVHKEVCSLL